MLRNFETEMDVQDKQLQIEAFLKDQTKFNKNFLSIKTLYYIAYQLVLL